MVDLLGAFSLAGDLALGLQAEHGARSCYIGMHIARVLALPLDQRTDLFYTELLKDAGCTTWTSQLAAAWLVDEFAAKRELQFFRDSSRPLDLASWVFKYVAAGAPLPTRASHVLSFLIGGREFMREGFESTCQVATRIAERLGMSQAAQDALMQVFEQWDGGGLPKGIKGEAISITSRIVLATSFLEVFHQLEGREAAKSLALSRRGREFDPAVVDAFLAVAAEDGFWEGLESERLWDTVVSMEPEDSPYRYMTEERLTDLTLALADFADLKAPFLGGHSRRVAEWSECIARRLSLPEPQIATIHRAALVHDIGLVAVPSFVLTKPKGQLNDAQREQLRLHPYYSQRVLAKVPALEPVIEAVAAHHEQMDGQGYHRGLPGSQIPPAARIIAVADRFDELTHDGPEGAALVPAAALDVMEGEAGSFLAPEVLRALADEVQGISAPFRGRRPAWPAGLTDREAEVLRLVAKGLSRREAARALFVSEGTVRSHLEHIYGKIGISNRAAATLFALEHGFLD